MLQQENIIGTDWGIGNQNCQKISSKACDYIKTSLLEIASNLSAPRTDITNTGAYLTTLKFFRILLPLKRI